MALLEKEHIQAERKTQMMRGELVRMEERFRLSDSQVNELVEERAKMRLK